MQPKSSGCSDRSPNPSGICMCGCGGVTPVADRSRAERGSIKGEHERYLHGHSSRTGRSLSERFAEHTALADDLSPNGMAGCLLWVDAGGQYGSLRVPDGGTRSAHRVAYEMAHGHVPAGLHIDHLCRRTRCVNPEHLEAVTVAVNNQRASRTKLTIERVDEIRALAAQGWRQTDIGAAYGVSPSQVGSIKSRKCWV